MYLTYTWLNVNFIQYSIFHMHTDLWLLQLLYTHTCTCTTHYPHKLILVPRRHTFVCQSSTTGFSPSRRSFPLRELLLTYWLPLARLAVSWSPPKSTWWNLSVTDPFNISCAGFCFQWDILLKVFHNGNHVFMWRLTLRQYSEWYLYVQKKINGYCKNKYTQPTCIHNFRLLWQFLVILVLNVLGNTSGKLFEEREILW